jgi:hypothetical protein
MGSRDTREDWSRQISVSGHSEQDHGKIKITDVARPDSWGRP